MRWRYLVAATALMIAGCGGEESTSGGQGTTGVELPGRPEAPLETERVTLSWETPAGESWPLDIVAPVESVDGGWPVLVTFHGAAKGTSAAEMATVAESGVVVVGPRWAVPEFSITNPDAIPAVDYVDGVVFDLAKCALSAAQRAATDYGGNPDWTTVEGFSAGVHPAAWVGLGVIRDDSCPDAVVSAPSAMVVGDSQWLFEHTVWDETFADETSRASDTVDRFLNPDRWSVPDDFVAYLWSTESTGVDRPVENPPAVGSWLRTRGGEDIVDDLDAVGAFDDESIGFLDNGLLQELRMQRSGVAVFHDEYPGGHTRTSEMVAQTIEVIWQQIPANR